MSAPDPTPYWLAELFRRETGVFIFAIHGRRLVKITPCMVDQQLVLIQCKENATNQETITRASLEYMLRFRNKQFLVFYRDKQIVYYSEIDRPFDVSVPVA